MFCKSLITSVDGLLPFPFLLISSHELEKFLIIKMHFKMILYAKNNLDFL